MTDSDISQIYRFFRNFDRPNDMCMVDYMFTFLMCAFRYYSITYANYCRHLLYFLCIFNMHCVALIMTSALHCMSYESSAYRLSLFKYEIAYFAKV